MHMQTIQPIKFFGLFWAMLVIAGIVLVVPACSASTQPGPVSITPSPQPEAANTDPVPLADEFSGLPFHLIGETVEAGGYAITLDKIVLDVDKIRFSATLMNHSLDTVDLSSALILYAPDGLRIVAENAEGLLDPGGSLHREFSYILPARFSQDQVLGYRLLYTPFGWSGPVIVYMLVESLPQVPPPPTPPERDIPKPVIPADNVTPQAYNGITGDPWKMLVLLYPNIDTDYIENALPKHLTASMPAADMAAMQADFANNQPHRKVVYDYSGNTAELEAHVVVVDRPLTDLEPISTGYWPSPNVTRPELDLYAPAGKYDSVLVLWQASDPNTGQSLPIYGWGLGYWPGDAANGMTYATVFNIGWYWPVDACRGEVFLHEWLHGVTGFYKDHLGFPFNVQDLHGAEEAGYQEDYNQDGCWDLWLRDYMRGLVYEGGQRKALVPETWQSGSITTHEIQGWRGEYYNNTSLTGLPVVVRDDAEINFAWQDDAPHPLLPSDQFSARWTRSLNFSSGYYRFDVTYDDGARLYVDNVLVFENWCENCWLTNSVIVEMSSGMHTVKMEMWENSGWASAGLSWQTISLPYKIFFPIVHR